MKFIKQFLLSVWFTHLTFKSETLVGMNTGTEEQCVVELRYDLYFLVSPINKIKNGL